MTRSPADPSPLPPRQRSRTWRTVRALGRALRAAWLGVGLVLLWVLILEFSLRGLFAIKDRVAGLPIIDPRLQSKGYDDAPWSARAVQEYRDQQTEWYPYVYFRERPYDGETITVDDRGRRQTWRPPGDSEGRARVLFLGGSAAWGVGARDFETIPSRVARGLAEAGLPTEVENLAEIGYVNTQEWITLALELRSGARPDAVVFYDGANEVLSAYQSGQAGLPQNESNRRREFDDRASPGRLALAALRSTLPGSAFYRLATSLRARLSGAQPVTVPPPAEAAASTVDLATAILDLYDQNRRLVEALADEFGFEPRFYWQPFIYNKANLTPYERDEVDKYASLAPLFRSTYEIAARLASDPGDDFLDLSGLLADSPKLLFTDFCHTTEAANAVVADAIVADLLPILKKRSSR